LLFALRGGVHRDWQTFGAEMIQLLIYGVAFLIVLKGLELFQTMLIETGPFVSWRKWVIWIGALALAMSVCVASYLVMIGTLNAIAIQRMANR
jgi:uncharacterized membrane protein